MARVVPNAFNEAAGDFTRNFISLMSLAQQRDLEEKRLAQDKQADEDRIEVSRGELKRMTALTAINALAPAIKEGSTIGDNPWLSEPLKALGVDASQPDVAGLVINKETFASALDALRRNTLSNMSPELKNLVGETSVVSAATGKPQTGSELNVSDAVAQVQDKGLDSLTETDVADSGKVAAGLSQPVRAEGLEFNSPASANLAMNLLQLRQSAEQFNASMRMRDRELTQASQAATGQAIFESAKSLVDQANREGIQVSIGPASMMVQAITRDMSMGNNETTTALLNQYRGTSMELPMRQLYKIAAGASASGEAAVNLALDQLPNGVQIRNSLSLGKTLADAVGKDNVPAFLSSVTNILNESGSTDFAEVKKPSFMSGGGFITPKPIGQNPAPADAAAVPQASIPGANLQTMAIENLYRQGKISRDVVIQRLGAREAARIENSMKKVK